MVALLDCPTGPALSQVGEEGEDGEEKRVDGSGLLAITRELRICRGVGRGLCDLPSTRCWMLALTRAFSCSQAATSSAFALASGSQVGFQVFPVLGSTPFHWMWYDLMPPTTSLSRMQSASQYVGLSGAASLALLESTYLARLLGFALVEVRFLFVGAITRCVRYQ